MSCRVEYSLGRLLIRGALGMILPLAAALPANAERLARLDQFYEMSWLAREGAPARVSAITQTTDGFLWLATTRGLVRFDGVEFRPLDSLVAPGEALLSPVINSLTPDTSGGLWIGYLFGGLSHLARGHLTHWSAAQGLPVSTTVSVATTPGGQIWASTSNGVYRLQGGRFIRLGTAFGLQEPPANFAEMKRDGAGRLWLASAGSVFLLRADGSRFDPVPLPIRDPETWIPLFLAPDGRMWAAPHAKGIAMAGPLPLPGENRAADAAHWLSVPAADTLGFRADGALWVSADDGLRVVDIDDGEVSRNDAKTAARDPLTIFVDREGTVWLGADNGLFSYRPTKLQPVRLPVVTNVAIVAGDSPGTLFASSDDGSIAIVDAQRTIGELPVAQPGQPLSALHRARDGTLWAASRWGVWRRRGEVFESVGVPSPLAQHFADGLVERVQALGTDDTGEPWVSYPGEGTFQHANGRWIRFGERNVVPHKLAFFFATDAAGRLWQSYPGVGLLRLDHADSATITKIEGLRIGNAMSIAFDGARTWVAGDKGLALIDEHGVRNIALRGSEASPSAGIAVTADGDLWLNGSAGIVRISRTELERALHDPSHVLDVTPFGTLDGLVAPVESQSPNPNMVATRDGRLWFADRSALFTLMPDRIRSNHVVPPVVIERVIADGRSQDVGAALALPVGIRNLQVAYDGLSLAIPRRERFRYMLEGQDLAWSEPTSEREATYTNLAPGRYTFRVRAANEDGVWNEAGASMEIIVPPAFWQTLWFRGLVTAAALASLWRLHRMRLRQVAVQGLKDLRTRLAERERIARELHDTLLQSAYALTMRMQGAVNALASSHAVRRDIESALQAANAVLLETRERVHSLRESPLVEEELSQALSHVAQEFAHEDAPEFAASCEGLVRPLKVLARDEAFRIGQESLRNAFIHARARHVRLEVRYGDKMFTLTVSDDGQGIDPHVLAAGGRPDHWGLPGVRERARALGAALTIDSMPGAGTQLRLELAAAKAYAPSARGGRRRWPWWR